MTDDNRYPTPLIIDVTHSSSPPAPPPQQGPPKDSALTKLWSLARKYVIAPLPVLLLVIGAAVLVALGAKNVQVGGLIGKLLGKKSPETKAIDVANSVPAGRVRADGSIIPIGAHDSKGLTQAQVVPIEKPGMFSDPKVIKVTPPGADKPIEVAVPDGVKAKDVEHVVVVQQEIKAVTVKSTSAIQAHDVDDLIAKYKR